MTQYKVPFIFEVKDGLLTPNRCPNDGEVIKVGKPVDFPYQTVIVSSDWRIRKTLHLLDTVSILFYDQIKVFQIQPVENEMYGRFVEIRQDRIEERPNKFRGKYVG